MKKTALMLGMAAALAISSSAAFAANANVTQKGSLLIFPKIDVREGTATWVRIVNDSDAVVTVKCYYMDVYKQRNDFEFSLTKRQPFAFDVASGDALQPIGQGANAFPEGAGYGELVCFATSSTGTGLANANNLAGTATVVKDGQASEYNAWAFKYNGAGAPPAGDLVLNGTTAYDSCPLYLFGQFSPKGSPAPGGGVYGDTTIDIASCKQDLRQDYEWTATKLQFIVTRYDETQYTGSYACANSFFESALENKNPIAPFGSYMYTPGSPFSYRTLRGPAYYRVQGVASTQCRPYVNGSYLASTATSLVGVQSSVTPYGTVAAELGASGTAGPAGYVKWDAFSGATRK